MAGEWAPIVLGDVCSKIGSGATPRGGSDVYLPSGPYALIRSQNVHNDGFHHEGLAYISEQHASELANVEVLEGDVLLNITGDSVARACQVDRGVLPARVNQHVAIIRPDPERLDPCFLRYLLVSPEMQVKLLSWAGSGGTRNALTKGMIESFEVSAPENINEQRAIAHILGTLDDKIEVNRKMSQTLEEMARAIFKSWFVDFDPVRAKAAVRREHPNWTNAQVSRAACPNLKPEIAEFFPDRLVDSELGEIPEVWGDVVLPKLIELNPTRILRKDQIAPYVDMANMPTRGHIPKEVVNRPFGSGTRFMNGDTLLARITPCLENGKTAFVDLLEEGQVGWGSTEYIVLRPREPLPPEFAYCLVRSEDFREFAIQSMTGTSGRQRVQVEALAHYRLAGPPAIVAKTFGSIVKPLFTRASVTAKESRTLAALRDALLLKLISGELRLKDAEKYIGRAL
jgi:type I restriction enzyme S subunit